MKTFAFVAVSLLVGIGLGLVATQREFAKERLPTKAYLKASATNLKPGGQDSQLEIEGGSTYDFGQMDRHAKGEHTFVIRNTGNTPIGLRQGQTTCKCTISEMKDGELQPGDSIPIKLTWNAKTGEQEFSQSAEILTSGYPQQPVLRLHVHGKIIDALRADRASLSLGSVSASENIVGRFKVYAYRGDEQLAITKHEFTNKATADKFSAESRPLKPEEMVTEQGLKSGVEVTIHVKSGLPLGAIAQTIRLTTNLPETAPLELPIEGRIVGDIMIVGAGAVSDQNIIALGATSSTQEKTARLHVLVKGPHRVETKLEISGVEPAGGFQAELGEALTDNPQVTRYPLTITIPKGSKPISRLGTTAENAGVLRIATTHPQVKELVVLVRYAVTE
jgi:hypothetical protein